MTDEHLTTKWRHYGIDRSVSEMVASLVTQMDGRSSREQFDMLFDAFMVLKAKWQEQTP